MRVKNQYLIEMGLRMKAIRKSQKISVVELGKLCGLDYSNISRIENGWKDAQIMTLRRIAEKLNVDVRDFI